MRSRGQLLSVLALGLLTFLVAARPAAAQLTGTAGTTGTTTTTGSLADGDIFIGIQATEGANLTDFDLARFFNQGTCNCDTPVFLYFTLTATGFAKRPIPQGTVSFWVGSQCNDPILQRTNCQFLKSDQIATFAQQGHDTIQTSARVISTNSTIATTSLDGGVIQNGVTPNATCTSPGVNGFNQTIWAIFDYGADGTIDFSATRAVFVDLTPPPTPTNIVVAPADEALNISWTLIDYTTNMDLLGYQIFCQRAEGFQVFPKDTFSSSVRMCATTSNTGLDGGVDPNGVTGLDPLFACSPLLNRTVDSFRVKILQNNIFYGATVVAIDNSGNAINPVIAGENFTQPQKTNTFWDVYRDGNITNGGGGTAGSIPTPGAATGGYCAVADGSNWTAGIGVGGGLLALGAAIARARRRRS